MRVWCVSSLVGECVRALVVDGLILESILQTAPVTTGINFADYTSHWRRPNRMSLAAGEKSEQL